MIAEVCAALFKSEPGCYLLRRLAERAVLFGTTRRRPLPVAPYSAPAQTWGTA